MTCIYTGSLTSILSFQKNDNKSIMLPLVEKYRPKIFNDILFDDFLKDKIKNILFDSIYIKKLLVVSFNFFR